MSFEPSMQGSVLSQDAISRLYEHEVALYYKAISSPAAANILEQYELLREPERAAQHISIPAGIQPQQVIDFSNLDHRDDRLSIAEAVSQIAVACQLLQGQILPFPVEEQNLRLLARQLVASFAASHGEAGLQQLCYMFESVEGIRVSRLLGSLGLLNRTPQNTDFLSVGSGAAYKELGGIFADTFVDQQPPLQPVQIQFTAKHGRARHTIVIDPEPGYAEHYAGMNRDLPNVLPMNEFFQPAAKQISAMIQEGALSPRNLVAAYRMDPVMMPDVAEFFGSLAPLIVDTTDCVISVGSGNDEQEFANRVHKLDEVQDYLSGRGMMVYRAKLYRGDSPAQGFTQPLYGYGAYATFDLLYCALDRQRLMT